VNPFYQWLRNKFGRIVTVAGALLQLSDLDISPIKPSLESILNHQWVEGIVVALFVVSHARHQWVANQHPKTPPLPPPATEATR
jgi:hypothetical protein